MQKKAIRILMAFLVTMMLVGCQNPKSKEQDFMHVKSEHSENSKKVIFLMIDSLMSQAIDEGIRRQLLPTFQFLIDRGQYYKDLVTSFPTMSVTIDSSLLTGKYPDGHRLPGLIWYSADRKRIVNYGTGPREAFQQGLNTVLTDALINMNRDHLNRNLPTIYEDLSRNGLKSGSINGLIYRGTADHTLSIPGWVQGLTSLKKEIKVKGPDFLALGSLSNPLKGVQNMPDGLTNRMGMNNQYSIEVAKYLARTNTLPDFLFIYLPDLDQKLHKKGPSDLSGVIEIDRQLHTLLQSFGAPEKALNDTIFIVAGDSGMTPIVPAEQNPVIDLHAMFEGVPMLRPGEKASKETEIALAVNETMAYVYNLKAGRPLREIAEIIESDPRVDFVAWKEKDWIYAIQGATSKQLKYKANGNLMDRYKQSWTVEQDFEVLDLKVNTAQRTLDYGQYPDALRRLSGALNSHQGEFLVVTAKPGYELADRYSPVHKGGGGHGSIQRTESLVPLIICGTNEKPQYLRMIDLKPFLLKLLTTNLRKTG